MTNYDLLDNQKPISKGKLTCDKKILASIVSLATKEINGVADLCHVFQNKVMSIANKSYVPGVKVKFAENGNLIVDVYIKIQSGFSVPDVAYRVQENIKGNITSMIDTTVKKINVHVMGVDFIDDKNA